MRACSLLLLATMVVGCDDSVSSDVGRVEAFLVDSQTASFTGDVNGNVQVSISADGTTWFDLGSLNGITAMLQSTGTRSSVHGEQDAPVGTYSMVRLTLSGVQARLSSGSTIGTTVLSSDTNIPLGGSDQLVTITLQTPPFTVAASDSERRTIVITLNAANWMTEAALQALTVQDAALETAITVSTMTEPRS